MLEKHKRDTYRTELDHATIRDLWNKYIKVKFSYCLFTCCFVQAGYEMYGINPASITYESNGLNSD